MLKLPKLSSKPKNLQSGINQKDNEIKELRDTVEFLFEKAVQEEVKRKLNDSDHPSPQEAKELLIEEPIVPVEKELTMINEMDDLANEINELINEIDAVVPEPTITPVEPVESTPSTVNEEMDEFDAFFNEVDIPSTQPIAEPVVEAKEETKPSKLSLMKSKKKDKEEAEQPLDKKEKQKLAKEIKRAKKEQKKMNKKNRLPRTAQETIPYNQIWKNGLCQIDKNTYSITLQYYDINYQLAKPEDKEAIFEQYCDFLNQFDSSISVQMSFVNKSTKATDIQHNLSIKTNGDGYDLFRKEYNEILLQQVSQGKSNIEKTKYITLTIKADSKESAMQKLSRIEVEGKNNLKALGCQVDSLDGYDRLNLLHDIMNQDGRKFWFNWDAVHKTGLTTKDFIAPDSFDFRDKRTFKIGDTYGAVSFMQIMASELSDEVLARLLDTESSVLINLHLQSVDQNTAMKQVKRKLSDLEKNKIEEQRKAVKAGYDMDILPPDLVTYIEEAKGLLDDLQSRNERMFMATIVITNFAESMEELNNDLFLFESIAQGFNCQLRRLDFQQEDGLVSSLPLGINRIQVKRVLTTSSTAIFVPFTTQELYQEENGMYYGLNALSNNLILCNRKNLKNPNGLILGTPGSGKSFSAKREIVNAFLTTNDDIIIVDPEREYTALVEALGGQVIHISQNSPHHINPMDINLNDDDDPVLLKSDFMLSLCELLIGGKEGLNPVERTLIDRCVHKAYAKHIQNPTQEPVPTMQDFYDILKEQPEGEAKHISTALELYVKGSLSIFNNSTNIDTQNRIICFDIKDLGKQLKKMGMLIVQEQVWNRVGVNREQNKKTWYYIDEFHLLLKEQQTAEYSVEIWKRFRKWGGIPTGLTQNVKDLLSSREVENILENSDFIYMLNQAPGDRKILAEKLGISEFQLSHVTNSSAGHGLIFFGNVIIPFADKFPKHTQLYKLMTTNPEEVAARKAAEKEQVTIQSIDKNLVENAG